MPTLGLWGVVLLVLVLAAPVTAQVANSDTVMVAAPALDHDVDRANILAAVDELEPGGTLQFAAGTYLVGERIRVPVPGVTILGHPAGTTLRGCEPSELERRERMECMGLELTGGRQTVRGLTFEHARFDLILGCCIDQGETPPSADPGGYLVEDNTFQASGVGVRVIAGPSETTVIRSNRFRDLSHAVGVNRGTVHIVDNDVSAPRPERVPGSGHPVGAITVGHRGQDACDGHEIAGNRIEDHPSAIVLVVFAPGTRCRGSVIRDNTIVVRRAHFTEAGPGIRVGSEADSTVVGVPIAVVNLVGSGTLPARANQLPPPAAAGRGGEAVIGGHLIEGNRVMGAEGIGIEIRGSSGNRIVDNVVTGIEPRDPFPGNVANSADPEAWRAANGSGIWISPGSEDNEIVGNTFETVAGAAVFLEGDRNRVIRRSAGDSVRDLGTGNEVSVAAGAEASDLASEERVAGEADTVHVASPRGDNATDRASILAALERARPGGTVLFAPGTYHVGEVIPLETPRVTLLGHPDGTTLRGCDPAEYEEIQREAVGAIASGNFDASGALHRRCGMFALTGGHVTVRDLTFEYSRLGLLLGCCHADEVLRPSPGGYRIEGNTFRNSGNSIRAILAAAEPTVIRGNRFINTFHALSATASRLHVLDNDISMPEPGRVPGTGHPGFAIGITALPPGHVAAAADVCEQNIIAGNRIDGHPDGILLSARQPGASCRENVVRENTIQVRRVRFPVPWLYADLIPLTSPEDSTFVGVPLALSASTAASDSADDQRAPARVENNRVENNRIIGAEGLGIAISHASGNRVANNTITGIERREPFPGNVVGWFSTEWREANGSGIWVSPGSDENEIVGNTFEDIAAAAVLLEGDGNRVELRSADDSVRDLGSGNRVIEADLGAEAVRNIARIYGLPLPEAEIRARWSVLPDGSIGEPITPDRIWMDGLRTSAELLPCVLGREVSSAGRAVAPDCS